MIIFFIKVIKDRMYVLIIKNLKINELNILFIYLSLLALKMKVNKKKVAICKANCVV